MDPSIEAAARALAAGDPLGALNRVALRDDAPALALRGIAMAQIGDMERARKLVRRAARTFGAKAPVAQARCRLVEAEIALATRKLTGLDQALDDAQAVFDAHGDRANAQYVRLLQARRGLLTGEVEQAQAAVLAIDPAAAPPALQAVHALVLAGIALRQIRAKAARLALRRAGLAAQRSGIATLTAEVDELKHAVDAPAACLLAEGVARPLRLDDVEALLQTPTLIIDGCRHVVQCGSVLVALARRPTLFDLARALGEAWPQDVARAVLVKRLFRGKTADESYRARLRVEIGRLRTALRPLAGIRATAAGYALALEGEGKTAHRAGRVADDDVPAHHAGQVSNREASSRQRRGPATGDARPAPASVAVLTPPVETPNAGILALLADGEAWSSSALALALGVSQRTLQRALDVLAAQGRARPLGRGRARRWTASRYADITTNFLLTDALAAA
ncbi:MULTISPECIES: helix-turn-helix domain-containing protein [unclassified Achromobacter]|uniref:helix-turn-helix domain-containing protein n=1 Tax=unclassified Achromobacter TaxID=2626865 RepID=UPI000B519F10|nr:MULTISPECIES: helix-turn-helix domain-containing protein [unclassified Achromobacter]OWT71551.1 helix-turn-helix domain-containing protein [Achromobacter sp. HZ34]OWT73208.1 helix-turn-helix domain-containing protein [Achromobacter sp. HZ28]